jgi:hypothetical protein
MPGKITSLLWKTFGRECYEANKAEIQPISPRGTKGRFVKQLPSRVNSARVPRRSQRGIQGS